MPINTLCHTWIQRIRVWCPNQRITQVRDFTWLMVGIYLSRSASLSRIAGKISGTTYLVSVKRGISRLLANPMIITAQP